MCITKQCPLIEHVHGILEVIVLCDIALDVMSMVQWVPVLVCPDNLYVCSES